MQTASNKPITINDANAVLTIRSRQNDSGAGVGYGKQISFANNDDLYIRRFSNGSFANWYSLAKIDSNDLTTLPGNLVIEGNEFTQGNTNSVYKRNFGGSNDLSWRELCTVSCSSGTLSGGQFTITLNNFGVTAGSDSSVETVKYIVNCRRSLVMDGDTDDALITGVTSASGFLENDVNLIRVLRTALGEYEIQVRQPVNTRTLSVVCQLTTSVLTSVVYPDDVISSTTTGVEYLPLVSNEYFDLLSDLKVEKNIQVNNSLTVGTGDTSLDDVILRLNIDRSWSYSFVIEKEWNQVFITSSGASSTIGFKYCQLKKILHYSKLCFSRSHYSILWSDCFCWFNGATCR